MFIAFVTFGAMYLIMGALIRLFTLKFHDTPGVLGAASDALTFAH